MSDPMPVEPKKNRTGIIIAVVVIVLCCCCVVGGGLGYWLWNTGDSLLGTGALINSLAVL
ncbi:MAG: hypothetical protein WCP19_14870 [Chloroflexota bacterium]